MKNKRIILIFILALLSTAGLSQTSTTAAYHPEKDPNAYLEQVHTDQTAYLTGDYLWFSLYLMEATSHQLSMLSKVAYVEILDHENKPVLQTKISLENGRGHGSLFIPASLSSGTYTLRSYTAWMTNFTAAGYFHKTIRFLNPFMPLAKPDESEDMVDVQFFPEGGSLVNGVSSKVAFRVVDNKGIGIPFRGLLISDKGDTISRFTPLKFGMGHFEFIPQEGTRYTAIIKNILDVTLKEVPLAPGHSSGTILRVQQQNESLRLTIITRGNPAKGIPVTAEIFHQGKQTGEIENIRRDSSTIEFDLNNLPEGVSQIIVRNEAKEPLAERTFFKRPDQVMEIDINTDHQRSSYREKLTIHSVAEVDDKKTAATLSASVYRLDALQDIDPITFVTNIYLTSAFQEAIESPDFYFSAAPEALEALDNLMLVYGWTNIRRSSSRPFTAIPEVRSQLFHARVTAPVTGAPVKDVPLYLSLPGKPSDFRVAYSGSDGIVRYELDNIYGPRTYVLQSGNASDSTLKIEFLPAYSSDFIQLKPGYLSVEPGMEHALESRSLGMQMDNIYYADQRAKVTVLQKDTLSFYGIPDNTYRLDDYVRFPAMLDVMKEYVTTVAVRRKNKAYVYRVLDMDKNQHFDTDPLILLDGVPVVDVDKMIAYDPLLVEKLEVIPRRYVFGPTSFPGIVSYSTYKGQLEGFPLTENALTGEYDGVQYIREYFSPVYHSPEERASRKPDMRTLLQWLPSNENGDATFELFTSDQPGKYIIMVQGLSKDGIPGYGYKTFTVAAPDMTKK